MVTSPVAMAFDENGRLFVAEMRSLAPAAAVNSAAATQPGRIRLLEDADGDGTFETSTVFADDLQSPSAIVCYGGGVYVAAGSEILYLKAVRGAGVADLRKTVFTGFGPAADPSNPMVRLHSFTWGLDNLIHVGTAGIGGSIKTVENADSEATELDRNDFAFDPRNNSLFLEAGPSSSALAFDNWGARMTRDFSGLLLSGAFDPAAWLRNPYFPKPAQLAPIADSVSALSARTESPSRQPPTSLATNFPARFPANISTNQPRPAVLAEWSGGGGLVLYRGSALTTNWLGTAFVSDAASGTIRRMALRERGLVFSIESRPDAAGNMVTSRLPGFRPMQISAGPDGALYVADFQSGGDSGRILRLVPDGYRAPKRPEFGNPSSRDLVVTLAHPDGWRRDTAARLLYERQDNAAVPPLLAMLNNSQLPLARLHALHGLQGLGALRETNIVKTLRDPNPHLRRDGLALAGRIATNGVVSDGLWAQISTMASDPAPMVRFQLALVLGLINRPERISLLADLLRRDVDDSQMRAAVLSSLSEGASQLFVNLAADPQFRSGAAAQAFLARLADVIGVRGLLDDVRQVMAFVPDANLGPGPTFNLLHHLGNGLIRTRSSLALVDTTGRLQRLYHQALTVALDDSAAIPVRLAAIRLLGVANYNLDDVRDLTLLMMGASEPENLHVATIAMLRMYSDGRVAPYLLGGWRPSTLLMRREILATLLARTERISPLLNAIENRVVAAEELTLAQRNFLRTCRDAGISKRALQAFGPPNPLRSSVIAQFKTALSIQGSPQRGQEIFRSRCARCHEISGANPNCGPLLSSAGNQSAASLMADILEPGTELSRGYESNVIETFGGEILIGTVSDVNGYTITVHPESGGAIVMPRSNISYQHVESWSLMPEGLEEGISLQGMADLISFLRAARN
jgi:putative membrane-bound dehydrogenase-like protein